MGSINNIWQKLSRLGVDPMETFAKREVILVNKILIIANLMLISFLPVEVILNGWQLVPYELLTISIFFFFLYLNHKKLHLLTKILTLSIGTIAVGGAVVAIGKGAYGEFNLLPIMLLPLLFFSEKKYFIPASVIIALVFFAIAYYPFEYEPIAPVPLETKMKVQPIMNLFTIIFLFSELYYFKNLNQQFETTLEKQKAEIEKNHQHITDSINYAQRIQKALLKNDISENSDLPDNFILFKPKDIVSGDFYWMLEKQGYLYMAAADCTGHGVPGAFVTMLGISFLNEINSVTEVLSPAQILDQLRKRIVSQLSQAGGEEDSKDGMDISLIRLHVATNELVWAGANNPLYLLRKDDSDIEKIKGDKEPIGYTKNPTPFTNHTFTLNTGDTIYLFSDGFADQFGGEAKRKFGYKRFRSVLIENRHESLETQGERLNQALSHWIKSGNERQIDDVCVIGIRL